VFECVVCSITHIHTYIQHTHTHDETVLLEHFEAAVDRVVGGLARSTSILSLKERRLVAYQ
jgi:ATP-dependent Zn protease